LILARKSKPPISIYRSGRFLCRLTGLKKWAVRRSIPSSWKSKPRDKKGLCLHSCFAWRGKPGAGDGRQNGNVIHYADAALDVGSDLISTLFGNAALAMGAVTSSMPFLYSAEILSLSTPSGRTSVRVNDP